MLKRLRSTWLAGGGAMLLVLALSGVVAAASILTAVAAPVVDPTVPAVVADTTNTFEDLDGNGVDDDCQTGVVADPVAAASAEVAADLDGDGQISVSEAAQSGRTGGKNCNHGGYVSNVARAGDEPCDGTEPADTTDATDATETRDEADSGDANAGDAVDAAATTTTETTTCTETQTSDTTVPTVCPPAPVTTTPDATTTEPTVPAVDAGPNAHGKAVAKVAHSTDVGGKNCNHGGAVSAAAHDTAARDAAKAARDAARAAKHLNKQHGKHHNG